MTFVVTEPCIKCKYGDCVDVCPVDAFHEGPNFMVIDPVECIDCSVCVVECPVSAIFDEADLPPEYTHYIALNAELSKTWPLINSAGEPLADAEKWSEVKEKFQYLEVPVPA